MTPRETKEFLSSLEEGDIVEYQHNGNTNWVSHNSRFSFEFPRDRYRIVKKPKSTKIYTLPLSEIDALEITRDMWLWLSGDISRTKAKWLATFQPHLSNIMAECACCEFTLVNSRRVCSRCPLRDLWGSNPEACLHNESPYLKWEDTRDLAAALRISQAAAKRLEELHAEAQKPKQPTLRPWKREEAPYDGLIRDKGMVDGCGSKILGFEPTGVDLATYVEGVSVVRNFSFEQLFDESEISYDQGKTWNPCGILE